MKEIISYLKAISGRKLIALIFLLVYFTTAASSQTKQGMRVKGQVLDESGASLAGADVTLTLTGAGGKNLQTVSSEKGEFEFSGIGLGIYTLKVSVIGFNPYESEPFEVEKSVVKPLEVRMSIASVTEQVVVDSSSPVSLSSENNATAIVLKGKDLETLPEDPDELANALQELAGPAAGPNGAQLFVDGFNGVRLPPRNSIREIRINTNPFSSEYDRLGFGRIEILTKPGLDQLHGEAFFNFNDESLNARNAFAPFRAPLQIRRFGGNLSGAIKPKKASFFLDFERRETDENTSINATILDSSLLATPFSTVILTPQRSTNFSSRIDYQLNEKTTFVSRYSFTEINNENQGIGNFSLASRGFDNTVRINTLNFTATTIINPKVINEVRLQLTKQTSQSSGDNSSPSLNVLGSFFGGGAQVGRNRRNEERFELQDYISIALSKHTLKTGIRLRGGRLTTSNTENFGGSYSFAGDINRDSNGRPLSGTITSLEQLRRVLLGQPGYRPSQFSINSGDPFVSVNQYDIGVFLQDEWRVAQNLTLSGGIRYETQTNLGAKYNFAPRLAFAYSPRVAANNSNGSKLTTVIRGGFGIFYDRFDDSFTLDTRRLDGNHITQFIATNPGFFPNIPNMSSLNAIRPIRRQIEEELESPYTMQFAIGVEQQLPYKLTTTVNYLFSRANHLLRSRNINAPLPGTFTGVSGSGVRPLGALGDIYLFEGSGLSRMHQLRIGLSRRAGNITFFSNYAFTKIDSNADGANNFPSSSFDLEPEYGRSSLQVKHALFLGSNFTAPYGIRFSPFLVIRSGRPFDITTGRDNNGDTRFTDRPSFAEPGTLGSITNEFGTFNPNPRLGETIIPRNLGQGPGFASLNLSVSKTFGFGNKQKDASSTQGAPNMQPVAGGFGGRPGGGPGGGGPGGGGGFRGLGDAGASEKRFNLTLTLRASNFFNRANLGNFTGSLASPIFGQSNFATEARRIEGQLRFRF